MREELKNQEVLAMYDVRGIQDYIFKTNAAKEVIGASEIVDNIIINGLNEYIKSNNLDKSKYLVEWSKDLSKEEKTVNPDNQADAFIKNNSNVLMQVMFIGGGNAYILFRTGEECSKVNKFLGKYVLEKTYSLNLAVAVVKKTESYRNDYENINDEMRRIKARMPYSQPMGALPFMMIDSTTGYPIFDKQNKLSKESYLKREEYKNVRQKEDKDSEKVFDNMVTEKGDNSTLAIIHIDGNSLGKRIMNAMHNINGYYDAITKMRKLSLDIDNTFNTAFNKMTIYLDEESKKIFDDNKPKYRKIIVAGDDITYVCNANLAIKSVIKFIEELNKISTRNFPIFSACAGIAFFNSHFPFSDAYKVAEACCESAKERAKRDPKNGTLLEDEKVGNFFDFQMCTNVNASDLDNYREKHYKVDGKPFIYRPYYVEVNPNNRSDDKNKSINSMFRNYSYKVLDEKSKLLKSDEFPRSLAKEIRNIISQGDNEIEKEISFLKSRTYSEFEDLKENKGIYYDACELMDFEWEVGEENDKNQD